jgi:hypothetical protein
MTEIQEKIDFIVNRDLCKLAIEERTVEAWFKLYGDEHNYQSTKSELEMLIFVLED